jgi:hypothetical protein
MREHPLRGCQLAVDFVELALENISRLLELVLEAGLEQIKLLLVAFGGRLIRLQKKK